jgi:hypothetical protein
MVVACGCGLPPLIRDQVQAGAQAIPALLEGCDGRCKGRGAWTRAGPARVAGCEAVGAA